MHDSWPCGLEGAALLGFLTEGASTASTVLTCMQSCRVGHRLGSSRGVRGRWEGGAREPQGGASIERRGDIGMGLEGPRCGGNVSPTESTERPHACAFTLSYTDHRSGEFSLCNLLTASPDRTLTRSHRIGPD